MLVLCHSSPTYQMSQGLHTRCIDVRVELRVSFFHGSTPEFVVGFEHLLELLQVVLLDIVLLRNWRRAEEVEEALDLRAPRACEVRRVALMRCASSERICMGRVPRASAACDLVRQAWPGKTQLDRLSTRNSRRGAAGPSQQCSGAGRTGSSFVCGLPVGR